MIKKDNIQISGFGGDKGGSGPVESPNSLISNQYAQIVDLLCEGEIEGLVNGEQSIYIDATPLRNSDLSYNFEGVFVDWRNGTQSQSPLIGNDNISSEVSVGVLINQSTPIIRRITDAELDSINVTISTPRFTVQDTSSGNLSGSSVNYQIELQSDGGGYVLVDDLFITGKAITTFKRSTNVILAGSPPWDIRITRITEDAPNSSISNEIFFSSYTKIIHTKLNYPNSALVGIRINAKQFKSIPSRGYDVKLLKIKIPSNYDPLTRIYTGIWDGTFIVAWTDNPAWCFYDLVTNDRYGLGKFVDISLTDKWALYEIAQYCDEEVNSGFLDDLFNPILEPRFTCNLYLQKRSEAYRVVRDMASIFRAMIFWSSNGISVVQDKPEQVFSQFTNASVINGTFNYEGSSSRVRHTTAVITWNDPGDAYKQKLEYIEDVNGIAKFGINELQTVAIGCTSRGQAHRLGKWMLYAENVETEVISFKIGLEGTQLRPGVIIRTIDSNRAGARYGGRIKSVSGTVVVLDTAIQLDFGTDYTISFVLPDGTISDKTITTSKPANTDTIDIDSVFSTDPIVNSVWVVSSLDLSPEEWRVINVKEDSDGLYSVSALEYNSSKYSFTEDGLELEEKQSTIWDNVSEAASGLIYEESLYQINFKTFGTRIHLSWDGDITSTRYQLRWRRDNDNYNFAQTNTNSIELSDVGYGNFDFQVIAYNALGVPSPPIEILAQPIAGITAPPEDVINFLINVVDGVGIFTWDYITDLDANLYEIRKGTVWDSSPVVGTTELNTYSISNLSLGNNDYMIKAIDLSGNYSVNETSASVNITLPTIDSLIYSFSFDDITFSWASTAGTHTIVGYEIRENGTDWDSASVLTIVEGNTYTEPAAWSSRTIRIKAIDAAGNYSSLASSITVTLVNPVLSGMVTEHTSDSFVMKWEAIIGSLGVAGYIIKYDGADWDSAVYVGMIQGTTYQQLVDWDSRNYRVRAIDSRGNLSNELTSSSVVGSPVAPVVTHSFTVNQLTINFSSITNTLAIKEYEIREGSSDWDTANLVAVITGSTYNELIDNTFTTKTFRIKAKDTSNNYSPEATEIVAVVAPTAPVITESYDEKTLNLSWVSTVGTFVISHYEVRAGGTTWANSPSLGNFDLSALSILVEWSSRNFFIKAIDDAGFESLTGSKTINITNSQISSATAQIVDNNVLLKWVVDLGTLPSDQIELRKGDDYATADIIGNKTGTFTIVFESIGGLFKYWLTPIDSAGNRGTAYSIAALVSSPPDYKLNQNWFSDFSGDKTNALINGRTHLQNGFEPSEIDDWVDDSPAAEATITPSTDFYSGTNSALITYSGPSIPALDKTISLEIPEHIAVHRNAAQTIRVNVRAKQPATNATAQFAIGYNTNGAGDSGWRSFVPTTSWQLFEFTYSVPAGSGTDFLSILGDVARSGDGVLIDELTISVDGNDGSFSNTGSLLAPIILGDTFAEHFDNNLWTTVDAQIAASYPYYLQPTPDPAEYIEVFDYGTILTSSTKISAILNTNIIAGTPTIVVTISISDDNITYTDYVGVTEVIDNNFRYVKITLDIDQAADDKGLLEVLSLEVLLDSKRINDAGTGTAVSTDTGGTTVTFNESFIDIEDISVTPLGTVLITAVVDFTDAPNPTDFKVLLFDSAGDRYSGDFTWSARGY